MVPKRIKKRVTEKGNYRIYLRAQEFYETMHQAKDKNNWNAVGLNGVHCTISSNNALRVFVLGFVHPVKSTT